MTLGRQGLYLQCPRVLNVHQPEVGMWLVASGTYTQQRPRMEQHRNADTISTRQNLSLETEQPSPRNPALHAGLGMYVNITDDKFTSASPQHFQDYK